MPSGCLQAFDIVPGGGVRLHTPVEPRIALRVMLRVVLPACAPAVAPVPLPRG